MSLIVANEPVIPGDFEVVWEPQDGSQVIAFNSRANHTLYEGARGPGKTVTQLMRFYSRVGMGYGQYWRGVIFDMEFDHLNGLVTESKKWFPKFEDGGRWLKSASDYKWVWPTGEELLFRHVKRPDDYDGFHGHEYPFIGWNELTKHPTSDLYYKFMSVNRSSFMPEKHTPKIQFEDGGWRYATEDGNPLPPIPLEVFSTCNPNGPGHNWVKRDFIDVAPRGTLVRTPVEIFNPQTQKKETIVRTKIAIFGSYRENKYLDPGYIAELETIKEPNLRRSWLFGDWTVTAGGALDDVWDERYNVVPRFVIPEGWLIDRSFDWGSTHPFATVWVAQADGTEAVLQDGTVFCPVKNSLVVFFEYYGCVLKPDGTPDIGENKGLKLPAREIAVGIRDREISMMENRWIPKQPSAGPADNQINNVNEAESDSIATLMASEGIRWKESDKSPGSRVVRLELLRNLILGARPGSETPGFYVMDHCRCIIATVPGLRRDPKKPDDVDTTQEDHLYDAIAYRVLQDKSLYEVKFKFLTPT